MSKKLFFKYETELTRKMELRNYSTNTIHHYKSNLRRFSDFSGKDLLILTVDELKDYLY